MSHWPLVVLSALVSLATIAAMLRFGRAGPLDRPNHRSLHSAPIPRGGGMGVLAGLMPVLFWVSPRPGMLAGLVLVALVSWWDDRRSLPLAARFASHLVAAAVVLAAGVDSAWSIWGSVLVMLYIVWMANLFNFMDGANGLAGGMAVVGFGAYGVAAAMAGQSSLEVLAVCVSAAAAGFLVFNFDPARIFMGDVGSVSLGFLAAALGLEGANLGAWPLWFPILVFAPFIADATVTLLRRMMRREKFWTAHREHYYQRLVRMGWSHRRLALAEYALMAACGVSALALLNAGSAIRVAGLSAWLVVYAGLMLFIDRRWTSSAARRGDRA